MSPDGPKLVSPEEKLLKLIRPKPAESRSREAGGGLAAPRSSATPFSRAVGGLGRRLGRWTLPRWWMMAIQLMLGGLVIGELIVVAVVATRPEAPITIPLATTETGDRAAHSSQGSPPASVPQGPDESLPPLAAAASRPLFQTPSTASGTPAKTTRKTSEEAKALAGRLSLIGIVAGNPAQAIIEDAQTKKTYFSTVGQALIEGLVVDDVRENRVILDLNGEKIELSL